MFIASTVDQYIAKQNRETRAPLFGAYIIISPSMVPKINVYDAVVTMRVSEKMIKLNDVITFLSQEIDTKGTPITHRVVGILETSDGERAYRTKGDANASEDRALIRQSEVLGKVILRIPMIGYVKTFLSSKIGWLVAIVFPCVGIIGYDILKLTGVVKTKKKEEEEVIEEIPEVIVEETVINQNHYDTSSDNSVSDDFELELEEDIKNNNNEL